MNPSSTTPPSQNSKSEPALDRRRQRSADPLVALGLLLERARRVSECTTLAIADHEGLLVAGAGHFADCEELAAYAPFHSGEYPSAPRRGKVETLDVDGTTLLLVAAGSKRPDLSGVARGCQRILRPRPRPRAL